MKPLDDTILARLTAWLDQQDEFVFLESSRVSAENHRSLLFTRPREWLVCRAEDDAADFMARVEKRQGEGFWLAGWLTYEFSYLLEPRLYRFLERSKKQHPLAVLGVFEQPLIYDHRTETLTGGEKWPQADPDESAGLCHDTTPSLTEKTYRRSLQEIQSYIRAGDTYQVNYTLHLDFRLQGTSAGLYRNLRRNQPVAYSAWIRWNSLDILSFSPELFFRADKSRVRVKPMKGTMSRGRTPTEDRILHQRLAQDPKNRSENVMIVDLLRNDLAHLLYNSGGGRVVPRTLFEVETFPSLLQMTSTIEGLAAEREALTFSRLITALFPCGSVTGAPKIRTMEIIRKLEQGARGVYCGAIGYAGPETCCFNVPIRTVELTGCRGRMGIGSGIVADSNPAEEWRECLLKGNFLTRSEPEFQLIETLRWDPEQGFFLLEYHLDRLQESAGYFLFPCDRASVLRILEDTVEPCQTAQRVRLLLHRDGKIKAHRVKLGNPAPESCPARVIFSPHRIDEKNPFFFHKTTRRELFDSEYARCTALGYRDVLFTNSSGQVTEGAISNVFIRKAGGAPLLTPPVSCGLLAGTFRRMLLERGEAEEAVLNMQDVQEADEIFIANSVRGLVRAQVCEQCP
jgi:para-aminobenzoate synthetase/4-amino-4-deoxychorismate lyase